MAYVSVTDTQLGDDDLSDILSVSAHNNERDGVTGLLMYHDQLFFQVLEGFRFWKAPRIWLSTATSG